MSVQKMMKLRLEAGENRRNPETKVPRFCFVQHDSNIERLATPAMGCERLTVCGTKPPRLITINRFDIFML